MTVLVFGKTGQVARALAAHPGVTCLSRNDADLSAPDTCAAAIRTARPQAVINAAAYTAVDQAEAEEDLAEIINGAAPGAMAEACAALGIPFVSISTDYVFDGSGTAPWRPNDPVAPLNAYGRGKVVGERAVAAASGTWAVLRTSWVFAPGGKNFVTTMLRLGTERDTLRIVADQIGGPTPAAAIATACLTMARGLSADAQKSGVYHFSGTPDVSWASFAREIFDQAGLSCVVEGIGTAEYPTPAARPQNSRLDCSAIRSVFGVEQPDWRVHLRDVIEAFEKDRS